MIKLDAKPDDFNNPFNAGQMMGIITVLMFIENSGGISDDTLQRVKQTCADNLSIFLKNPSEDILMMIDNVVKEMSTL